jgi:hypothetical protein
MTGRTMIVALLALMLAACSNSGREPLLEQDGTIQEADSADSGGSAADVTEMDDTTVADGPQDVTTPPQDATLVDISAPDQTIPVDIVGPKDAAPFEIAPADVVPEVIPVDIVPQGPTCGDIFKCGIGKGCGLTSDICWTTCYGEANESELQAFEEVKDCVAIFCEDLPPEEQGDCLMSACINEVLTCLGGDGEAGCLDTFFCIQGCAQDDDGLCYFECIEDSSQESLELLLDMSNATENESMALLIECAGGQGDLNCGETVMCFTSCEDNPPPPDDPSEDPAMDCMMTCISESSPEGAEDLLAFLDCAEEACPDGMDECPGMFACLGECPGLMF